VAGASRFDDKASNKNVFLVPLSRIVDGLDSVADFMQSDPAEKACNYTSFIQMLIVVVASCEDCIPVYASSYVSSSPLLTYVLMVRNL